MKPSLCLPFLLFVGQLYAQWGFSSFNYDSLKPETKAPDCAEWTFIQLELALQSIQFKDPKKGLAIAQSARNGELHCPQAWQVLARALFSAGNRKEALATIDSAILHFGAFPPLVGTKAQLLFELSDQNRRYISENTFEFPGPDSLFRFHVLKEAQTAFQFVLSEQNADPATAEQLALVCGRLGDFEGVVAALKPIVEESSFPEMLEARWMLAQAYLHVNAPKEAELLMQPWIETKPQSPSVDYADALLLYAQSLESSKPTQSIIFRHQAEFHQALPQGLNIPFSEPNYQRLLKWTQYPPQKRFGFIRKETRKETDSIQAKWMVWGAFLFVSDPDLKMSGWILENMPICWPFLEKMAESRDDQIQTINKVAHLGGAAAYPPFVHWARAKLNIWTACCLWSNMPDFLMPLKMADPLGTLDLTLELWNKNSTLRRESLEEFLNEYPYHQIIDALDRVEMEGGKKKLLLESLEGTK